MALQCNLDAEARFGPYRAVYVLNKSFLTDHEAETGIRLWEPRRDDHGRLVNHGRAPK